MDTPFDHEIIESFLEAVLETNDTAAHERLLCDLGENLGFPMILYAVSDTRISEHFPKSIPFIGNFSSEWMERYIEEEYLPNDPVPQHCTHSNRPVIWEPFFKRIPMSRVARKIQSEAHDFGIENGITIPIHTRNGLAGVLSAVPDGSLDTRAATINEQFLRLFYLAHRFHAVFASALWNTDPATKNLLTKRQQECLRWSARGKTSEDIGDIIGISTPTVEKHIREAIFRLNTTSRIQAVAKAVHLRLIDL